MRAGLLALVARTRGAAVITHAHGGRLVSFAQEPLARFTARASLAPSCHVVAVADAVSETLHDLIGPERVVQIANGVDTEQFRPSVDSATREVPRVLYVGHLTERKGVLDLIDASGILHDRGVPHELVIVGGRSDDGESAYRAVLDRLPQGVDHLSAVEHADMPAIYQGADVFCLPSWWEAMPLSVLEAMSCGLPVVATGVGDVCRLVEADETGLIVEPRDPERLADALEALLVDSQRRSAMGAAGRERAGSQFGQDRTLDRIRSLYRAVGSRKGDREPR